MHKTLTSICKSLKIFTMYKLVQIEMLRYHSTRYSLIPCKEQADDLVLIKEIVQSNSVNDIQTCSSKTLSS